MKQSEKIGELASALVAAQLELRGIGADATNPDFRSRYASLDKIIATVRPILAKHGLAVVQGATTPHSDDSGKLVAIVVETMLVHSSGEWLVSSAIMPVVGRILKGGARGEVDAQAGGSALTYGRRYGLAALLCLATDEDDDGNAASGQRNEGRSTGGAQSAPRQAASTTDRAVEPAQPPATTQALSAPLQFIMPIGKNRGKKLGTLPNETLQGVAEWVHEKAFQKKHADLLVAIAGVLKIREAA